jgi:hypothetical protein
MTRAKRLADVGQVWDLDVNVEVIREQRRALRDGHRFKIALGVLGGIAIGLAALGWHGMQTGQFGPVQAFWTAAGPIFGGVIGFHFGKSADDG